MRHSSFPSSVLAVGALAVLLSACGDDVTDPDAFLESAEAEAVIRSAEKLPSLAELIDAAPAPAGRTGATLAHARELWVGGSAVTDQRAAARRRLAVGYAAPLLAQSVAPEEWRTVRERIDAWVATADGLLHHLAVPGIDARLEAARRYLARSDASDDARTRTLYLLLATSELVETTPRFVARRMTLEAEAAVRRAGARTETPLPPATLERATRLKDWAARAVEEEDYLLAIQRAYYALQLAEGR